MSWRNARDWEWLALAAVVAAATITGRQAMPAALDAALIAGLTIATAVSAPLGCAAVIASGLLGPWTLPTGTQTNLPLCLLLLMPLVAGWTVRTALRRAWSPLRTAPLAALGAFCAAAVLAFAVANLTPFGCGALAPMRAQIGGLAGMLLPIGGCIVAATELDQRWLARLTALFLIAGGLIVLPWFVPAFWDLSGSLVPLRADGSLLWVWVVALAAGQAVAHRTLHAEWRLGLAWLAVIAVIAGVIHGRAEWLAGWVPGIAALGVLALLLLPQLTLLLAGVGSVASVIALHRLLSSDVVTSNRYSLGTRVDAWVILLGLLRRNPLVGFGPANYYHCTPQVPIRGYAVHFSSHNNFVDIAAQTGVLGLGCFVWFLVACGLLGWRGWRRMPDGFGRGYIAGCLAGFAGTLVAAGLGDWWLPFVYNETLACLRTAAPAWIFLGGMINLARTTRAEPEIHG